MFTFQRFRVAGVRATLFEEYSLAIFGKKRDALAVLDIARPLTSFLLRAITPRRPATCPKRHCAYGRRLHSLNRPRNSCSSTFPKHVAVTNEVNPPSQRR